VLIFLARICDVSIGTVKIICISRGHKLIVPILGFIEVLIWLVVMVKIIQNLNNVFCYLGFAGGFATGNYVGMYIEQKMAIGSVIFRIISRQESQGLIDALRQRGYGATIIKAEGASGDVSIIYTIVKRHSIGGVEEIVKQFNPKAFYSVEDVRYVSEGVFPAGQSLLNRMFGVLPMFARKGK